MRLGTVTSRQGTSAARFDGQEWRALPAPDLSQLLRAAETSGDMFVPGEPIPDAVPVLPLPAAAKVLCCGLNYADHIREMGRELPAAPTLFAKFADTLAGPADDLVLPGGLQVDWEAELAVVIGRTLRRADRETALAGIAGYTVANDVSVRDWQHRTTQWLQGKAWDGTTPVGPVVVTPDEVDPVRGLTVSCRVNGAEVQRATTATLVFDAADLVSYASTFTTLRPGDLILTGTPGGVGAGRDPQVFLADGDVLETEIEGIGTLRNTIRFEG